MSDRQHVRLMQGLYHDYEQRFPSSKLADSRARNVLVDGISHGARLFKPYPFRISEAQGAYVTDIDGHQITDFWQGHFANILGHNPAIIRQTLVDELENGYGLQTGLPEDRQTEYAETLAQALKMDRVRLTTAGTLATMYAMMLSRAFTGRQIVVKLAGGWHGANPLALKGVQRNGNGFDQVDSAGVPETTDSEIMVTRFNDAQRLRDLFAAHGDHIACLIMELCPSHAGFVLATPEFVQTARELTSRYGAMLILDEVITGFRFCAGGMQQLYGVQGDISTFGKIIGGGMPVSALAGRADVMGLASEQAPSRVWFNGGTFSAHPLSMLAGKVMIEHLVANQDTIYPDIAAKGARLRKGIEQAFAEQGVLARCAGHPNQAVTGSSLGSVYFPLRDDLVATATEDLDDPALCDQLLQSQAIKLGLLLHDVNLMHGMGAVSASHSDADIEGVISAFGAFAERLASER